MFQYTFCKNVVIDEAASALERPMEPEMFETSFKVRWRSETRKALTCTRKRFARSRISSAPWLHALEVMAVQVHELS